MPFFLPKPRISSNQSLRLTYRAKWCVRLGYVALIWQGLWPRLLPFITIALTGLALTLSGFWLIAPTNLRWLFQAIFGALVFLSLYPLLKIGALPTYNDVVRFLDSDTAHAPLQSAHDTPAGECPDALTRQLWNAHQKRTIQQISDLNPRLPHLHITKRDPYALRHMALLACIAACFTAGSDWRLRIASAFIAPERLQGLASFRVDGWINPPVYTRLPPVVLEASDVSLKAYRIPIGSEVLMRFAGINAKDITLKSSEGLNEQNVVKNNQPETAKISALLQKKFIVTKDAKLVLHGNWLTRWSIPQKEWTFSIIPDLPPQITLIGEPLASSRGNLEVIYTAQDDYGLHSLEAVFEPTQPDVLQRAIIAPPRLTLNIPAQSMLNNAQNASSEITKTLLEIADHPWAGSPVKMHLVARDEASQETKTPLITLELPQRTFTKPMAKALSDLRRDIVLDRSAAKPVQKALEALQLEPEMFQIPTSQYLGLRLLSQSLERLHRRARLTQQPISNEALLEIADLMWEMAVRIEDGDIGDSERALKAAQQALDKALKEGATPQELTRLSQELRQAMDRYVKDMKAQNRLAQPQTPSGRKNSNIKTISPEYLADLLKRIEELAQSGQTAEAQKLLDQLKNIMNNLQNARPKRPLSAQEEAQRKAIQQSMRDLGALYQDQNNLRDQTFQQDTQQQAQDEQEPQNEQGMQNERSQDQKMTSQEMLKQRQKELRDRLDEMQKRFSEQGLTPQTNENKDKSKQQQGQKNSNKQEQAQKNQGENAQELLNQAEQNMKKAEQNLQDGNARNAVDAQGKALDLLGKAQAQLAEQLQGGGEGGEGEGEGSSQSADGAADNADGEGTQENAKNGKNNPREDPLGRQTRNSRNENGKFTRQGERSSLEIRIEEIIQELRKRMSDPHKRRDEMDYLERLLKAR